MIEKVLTVFLLLWCNTSFSQKVEFIKLNEQEVNHTNKCVYSLKIYNNTDKPICIPVSNDFAYSMSIRDTLELDDVYDEKDSVTTLSLFWSKEDLKIEPQQKPSFPIILNPGTYLLTNIKFTKKPSTKEVFFELKHSFGPQLNYDRIMFAYNTKPKFMWKKSLKFTEVQLPVNL